MTQTSYFLDEWQKYTGMVKTTMYIFYHFRIIKGVYAIFAMIWMVPGHKGTTTIRVQP